MVPRPRKQDMFPGSNTQGYGPPTYGRYEFQDPGQRHQHLQDGKKRAVGTLDSLAFGLGGSSATSAEVVYVLAIALGLGVARDLGNSEFAVEVDKIPEVIDILLSDEAKKLFPYMRTTAGLNMAARFKNGLDKSRFDPY
jgi:hypothetical protein